MNIHEFQAKALFRDNSIPVPKGFLATTPIEAEFAFRRLGGEVAVVKAQVHAGGRGKAGGVKLVKSAEEANSVTEKMIGMKLITPQTGEQGKIVHKVYVEAGSKIEKEYYLALLLDRKSAAITFMFSTEGGMNIEDVAHNTPEKIAKINVDPTLGLKSYHITDLLRPFDLPKGYAKKFRPVATNLYKMFLKYDFSLLEINPLIWTTDGEIMAIDGKMNFDDNALFRHPEIEMLRDFAEEDAREIEASKSGLSYIGLDGNIGCLVNGAGLAMATMDIIKHYGGAPANFLDVGGGATEEMVRNAFRIIFSDKHVKTVFVNIFGGIMQCDVIANGICGAAKELGLKMPLIVRLEGTNVDKGREILANSGLSIISASDMADGARKAVEAANK